MILKKILPKINNTSLIYIMSNYNFRHKESQAVWKWVSIPWFIIHN